MADRRQRDKEQTISEIMDAAIRLFSEKGFHGTSIRDIENVSGVSKGLILHHFENKENLYAAVQDYLAKEYVYALARQRPSSDDYREMIKGAIRNSFVLSRDNYPHRRIMLWSYLQGHRSNPEFQKQFVQVLIREMREGQEKGLVREEIDPLMIPFIVKGTIEYWFQQEDLIHELAPEQDDDTLQERLVETLTRLFVK